MNRGMPRHTVPRFVALVSNAPANGALFWPRLTTRRSGTGALTKSPIHPFADAAGAYGENVPTVRAWTYHGRPVYTFSGDKYPGEALAHGMMGTSSAFGVITLVRDRFPFRP